MKENWDRNEGTLKCPCCGSNCEQTFKTVQDTAADGSVMISKVPGIKCTNPGCPYEKYAGE